jgi:hypothetical protein
MPSIGKKIIIFLKVIFETILTLLVIFPDTQQMRAFILKKNLKQTDRQNILKYNRKYLTHIAYIVARRERKSQ